MKKQLVAGVTIDADAIAKSLYGMMTDDYRAALMVGMLPAPIMEALKESLAWRAENIARERAEKVFGIKLDPAIECAAAEWKASFVEEATSAVTQAMFAVAPMAV